ncbi:DUF2849 domain-containing protein [Acuticoccus mangrovi]|uniref:DUF2849 domain-containing protein n=1 Tax=Acuticoccus mangrovi TaxID=2796142 RepID=A0A934IM90_9HYPH|nr:DUF2849 domain-containing protein [Acuticoccus mangrovi]MBJ3775220.1 DUF2849 domain-containing protein [Acuticoccus mangrovi]
MAKQRVPKGPSVLTANDLLTGTIVYWTGDDWSASMHDALRADDEASRAALEAAARTEEDANRVVGAYLFALDPETGAPVALRERQRLGGPSIILPISTPRAA